MTDTKYSHEELAEYRQDLERECEFHNGNAMKAIAVINELESKISKYKNDSDMLEFLLKRFKISQIQEAYSFDTFGRYDVALRMVGTELKFVCNCYGSTPREVIVNAMAKHKLGE